MKKGVLLVIGFAVLAVGTFFFFHVPQKITNYPSGGKTIVMLGDSLTEGVGARSDQALPVLLSEKIGEPVINMGISGNTTKDALARVQAVIDANPKMVIILLGGNDYLQKVPIDQTFQNLDTIITKVQSVGAVVVLLGIQGGILRDPYADRFKSLAKLRGAAFVPNVFSGIIGNPKYMSDEVHPNDAGYAEIAAKVAPAVLRYMR